MRQPAVGAGDVEILLARHLEDAGDLAVEGGAALVGGVGVTQYRVRAVPAVTNGQLRGVGEVAGGARGHEVVLALAQEMGGSLADVGRVGAGEVGGVVARHVGVVLGEVGADGLGMDALEVVVGLAVGSHHQIEVTRAHIQGAQTLADNGVGACQRVGGEDGLILGAVAVHDLEPADEFLGLLVVDDVGSVHQRRGVDGGGGILGVGRDDQTQILPVVEVGGLVAPHAPVPDALFGIGEFLVLAVPVVRALPVHDGSAVGLDALALGVQPDLTGADGVVAVICHDSIPP